MDQPTPAPNLHKYDGMDATDAVIFAWKYPGRRPDWHQRKVDEVRRGMPLLARALDRLAAEQGR